MDVSSPVFQEITRDTHTPKFCPEQNAPLCSSKEGSSIISLTVAAGKTNVCYIKVIHCISDGRSTVLSNNS